MATLTYYKLLTVDPDATTDVINAAYRSLSKKYHPDTGTSDAEMFRRITEAHEVLVDETKRAIYDSQIEVTHQQSTPPPTSPFASPPTYTTYVKAEPKYSPSEAQFRDPPIYYSRAKRSGWLATRSWPLLIVVFISYQILRAVDSAGLTKSANNFVMTPLSWLFSYVTFGLAIAFLVLPKKRVNAVWKLLVRMISHVNKRKKVNTKMAGSKDNNLLP